MRILYEDRSCWLGVSYIGDKPFLHTEIEHWSVSMYKKYIGILASALTELGTNEVYSVTKTKKAMKFNELFGFEKIGTTPENYNIMRLYVRRT